jgi:predicted site-specific integrase-resolvase
MPSPGVAPLLGSADVCKALGIDRSTLSRWIKDGTAVPSMRLPGKTGAYLFTVEELERLADGRAA